MKLRKFVLVFLVCAILVTTGMFVVKAEKAYTDVSKDFWGYNDIQYVTNQGLMLGVGENVFGAETTMSRAMLSTILWRMEGSLDAKSPAPFSDLEKGSWYEKAVAWTYENKIVYGVGDNLFAPDDEITREQLVTMLYRYSAMTCYDTAKRAAITNFADSKKVSDWAKTAVEWAVGTGMLKGTEIDGALCIAPLDFCTRAEAAALIHRFETKVEVKHTEEEDKAVPPTCTTTGLTEGKHCSKCGLVIVPQEIVGILAHTEVIDNAVDATCTTDGLTQGSHCSVCNKVLVKQEKIKAKHNYEEAVKDQSTLIYTCSVCGDFYEEEIPNVTVSVRHTGTSSATMNGYGSYSKFYEATATGGYGTLQYKFEVYRTATASTPISNLTKDFSEDNTYGISYRGYEDAISGYVMVVTVKDSVGNQATNTYEF